MSPSEARIFDQTPDLPDHWLRPTPNMQTTLFPCPTDAVLAGLGVGRGDARRWRELGWISFDVDAMERLDQPEEWEIAFVRNLARSPLTIQQIEELIAGLPRPLRYDPKKTVYHLEYGWVIAPPPPQCPCEDLDGRVEEWIDNLGAEGDLDRLQSLARSIESAMERAEKCAEKCDEEEEE